MVRAVEALTPKMLSHFWGPHEPSGFDSHIHLQDLLNKKTAFLTQFITMVRAVEALTPKMLSHFWGPREPKGSTPTFMCKTY